MWNFFWNFSLHRFWDYSVWRKKTMFFLTLPGRVSSLWLPFASLYWSARSGASWDSSCVACKVLVEKILEVGDQCSIMKTFFVMAGVQNIGIVIAILALFLAFSNFHKMKIPMVNLKSSILFWGTKNFHQKKLKSPKDMLKWFIFRKRGSQGRGWCMDPTMHPL
jgi:hypothetical protein